MGSSQQFSLRWNNYLRHITGAFDSLRIDEDLVDVTLSCEGKKIRAHKMLLSACSSYFKELFKENPCQHPVIIFKDVRYHDLEALVNFMYQGEVNVLQEHLSSFLNTAELLSVQGLTDGSSKDKGKDVSGSYTNNVKASTDSVLLKLDGKQSSNIGSGTPAISNSVNIGAPLPTSNTNSSESSSPVAKKRKCVSSVASVNAPVTNVGRGNCDENNRVGSVSSDSEEVEMVPVVPNVKVEQPDYFDQEQQAPVTNYNDKIRASENSDNNVDTIIKEEKNDILDSVDCSNNSNDKVHHINPLLDLNQVMSASGPSLDMLPQEPLHGHWMDCSQDGKDSPRHSCEECGATYKHLRNLRAHLQLHMGKTQCKLCNKVLCNRSYFRKHLLLQHGISGDDQPVE